MQLCSLLETDGVFFFLEKMMKAVKQRAEEGGEYYLSVLTFAPKGNMLKHTDTEE